MDFEGLVAVAARIFEVVGVGVMLFGALAAFVRLLTPVGDGTGRTRLARLRNELGYGILLGLELLVAADIIRSVAQKPAMGQVLILGLIVLIRTFLSFTLEVELDGTWPWRRSSKKPAQPPSVNQSPAR